MSLSRLLGWARGSFVALAGSDAAAARELFRRLDGGSASDWGAVASLVDRREALPWRRSWSPPAVADPGLLWESALHGAPDLRTPLLCALLAYPRYRLAALLQSSEAARRHSRGLPSSSLGGLTASTAPAGAAASDAAVGAAARRAAARWRLEAAGALLLAPAGPALVELRDAAGRGPLHYAAAAGDWPVIELLLSKGACRRARDAQGRTPAHVAAAARQLAVAEALREGAPEADGSDVFGHSAGSIAAAHAELSREAQVPRLAAASGPAASLEELFRGFVATGRPAIIPGGARHLGAARWAEAPASVEALLGQERLSAGPVPYAQGLGLPGGVVAPLSELLGSPALRGSSGQEAPSYVFDAAVLRRRRDALSEVAPLGQAALERLCAYARVPQLGIGYGGAGAPMHTHHAALNALFVGRKRWFLLPPEHAYWSLQPVSSWVRSQAREAHQAAGQLLEADQRAGDLLFVPEGWGHATQLEGFGVGVGQEFVPLCSVHS